jgi:hypothetical protein
VGIWLSLATFAPLNPGLGSVLFDREPLKVVHGVMASAHHGVSVVNFPAWAGAALLASGGAGVGLAKFCAHGWVSWKRRGKGMPSKQ